MDLIKNIFKGDKVIWIIFLFLCTISIIEVFSATSTLSYKSGDHWEPITQHFIYLIIGLIFTVIVHSIQYKWFQVIPTLFYPLSVILLALTMFMGYFMDNRVNGAARWMNFFGFQFQPSELAKLTIVLVVASILSKRSSEKDESKPFKHIMIKTLIICLLIAPENLSTAVLIFGVVMIILFIGHISVRRLFMVASIGILLGGSVFAVGSVAKDLPFFHRFETWKSRVVDFIDNEKVPAAKFDVDKYPQVAHANIAIATSHVIGKGPGNSVERDSLSQAFSDFIYAIIIEELGLAGGVFVLLLYIWLLIRAGRIANKCDRTFPAYLVLGIAVMMTAQAMLNMMVSVGLLPITGQILPLISRGGTATVMNCVCIGMILSVSRYTERLGQEAGTYSETEENADEIGPIAPTSESLNNDSELVNK
ncbi:putative lipid II flippase FtsW [termite gut metagenome]|uniref:peptidoglycan glycosyltransferase n=1 Tax=termite gut metagenome TaxID=433724 RepID=A0A5J4S135_9ZZZZ